LDTWRAFRAWHFIWPLALFATFIIHAALSYPTVSGLLPDPFFRIYVEKVHRNKHGSDSMTFDGEGRFRPQNFEDFFAKYDKDNKKGLTKWDIATALRGQAFTLDLFGCSAALLECKSALVWILGLDNGS
jgi:peroxygenase